MNILVAKKGAFATVFSRMMQEEVGVQMFFKEIVGCRNVDGEGNWRSPPAGRVHTPADVHLERPTFTRLPSRPAPLLSCNIIYISILHLH